MTFSAVFAGFFMPMGGLATAAAAALLALLSNLFLSLAESAFQKPSDLRIRYRSVMIYGMGGSIMLTFLRLWLLPFEAWICFSALITSLWRMTVSHKNSLRGRQLPSPMQTPTVCGRMRFPCGLPPFRVLYVCFSPRPLSDGQRRLLWLCAPVAAWALSLPARKKAEPDGAQRRFLTDSAAKMWAYFDKYCGEEDNFCPG